MNQRRGPRKRIYTSLQNVYTYFTSFSDKMIQKCCGHLEILSHSFLSERITAHLVQSLYFTNEGMEPQRRESDLLKVSYLGSSENLSSTQQICAGHTLNSRPYGKRWDNTGQGSANCGPLSLFANKVLLTHSPVCLFTNCLWLLSCYRGSDEQLHQRLYASSEGSARPRV